MMLDIVAIAQAMDLPFVYLGYYVKDSPKMNYKNRFQPCEVLIGGIWQVLTDCDDD